MSAICFNLDQSKLLLSVNGLIQLKKYYGKWRGGLVIAGTDQVLYICGCRVLDLCTNIKSAMQLPVIHCLLNSLPNYKILDLSEFRAT